MLCESFYNLIPMEKRDYIGNIIHCVMNDEFLYLEGQKIIKKGQKKGLFEGVKINPIINNQNELSCDPTPF